MWIRRSSRSTAEILVVAGARQGIPIPPPPPLRALPRPRFFGSGAAFGSCRIGLCEYLCCRAKRFSRGGSGHGVTHPKRSPQHHWALCATSPNWTRWAPGAAVRRGPPDMPGCGGLSDPAAIVGRARRCVLDLGRLAAAASRSSTNRFDMSYFAGSLLLSSRPFTRSSPHDPPIPRPTSVPRSSIISRQRLPTRSLKSRMANCENGVDQGEHTQCRSCSRKPRKRGRENMPQRRIQP